MDNKIIKQLRKYNKIIAFFEYIKDIINKIYYLLDKLIIKIRLKKTKGFCEMLTKMYNAEYFINVLNNEMIHIYFKNNKKLRKFCKKNKLGFIFFSPKKYFYEELEYYNDSIYYTNCRRKNEKHKK